MNQWKPIKTAPKNGEEIDVWMHIYASPRSFGMSDSFRVIDVRWKQGRGGWWHWDGGTEKELYVEYVTHWMPRPKPPKG